MIKMERGRRGERGFEHEVEIGDSTVQIFSVKPTIHNDTRNSTLTAIGSARRMLVPVQYLQEMQCNAEKTHETIRAQVLAFQKLERKVEEQDRELKAQAGKRRLDRENAELREGLRNEREARMWDTMRTQELAVQELKRLMEVMAHEQREPDAQLQQEQIYSAQESERHHQRVQEEIGVNATLAQTALRAHELAVQELARQVEEQAHTQTEKLRLERERTEREMVEMSGNLQDEIAAKLQEASCAQDLAIQDLKGREAAMALENFARDARGSLFQRER